MKDRNIVLVTQARMGSTRLPGKVLKMILGKEMLLRFVERILPAKLFDYVVVATTELDIDRRIIDLVSGYNPKLLVFAGSEDDVLDRYYKAITALFPNFSDEDVIVRVTSDCPLIDCDIIDLHIREFLRQKVDYLSSRIDRRTWPHGMEVEVFCFKALCTAWKEATLPSDREHVTPYIYRTAKHRFALSELRYHQDLSHLRFTVDYPEDLTFVSEVYKALHKEGNYFHLDDILSLLRQRPELLEINKSRINPAV